MIAVLCSLLIKTSVNAGTKTRLTPLGATNPLAIAIALIAWFKAPAPIAWISVFPFSSHMQFDYCMTLQNAMNTHFFSSLFFASVSVNKVSYMTTDLFTISQFLLLIHQSVCIETNLLFCSVCHHIWFGPTLSIHMSQDWVNWSK